MKRIVPVLAVLFVVVNMNSCGVPSGFSEESSAPDIRLSDIIEDSVVENTSLQEEPAATVSGEGEMQLKAFGKVLWDAWQKGILPDGRPLDYTNMESASENNFAITDIDGDGEDELLLIWENACMAGMVTYVFGYGDGAVYVELSEWPGLTFYDNGTVRADWSHNQSMSDFWPYSVYRYDAENDVYQSCGGVSAWDKSLREKNYEGELFPSDVDADEDGTVYVILPADWNGQYVMPWVDGADYENWRKSYFDGAEEIPISTQKLTEENIAALGYPKPDVPIPEPAG